MVEPKPCNFELRYGTRADEPDISLGYAQFTSEVQPQQHQSTRLPQIEKFAALPIVVP